MKCKICGKKLEQKSNNPKDRKKDYCEDCKKEYGW